MSRQRARTRDEDDLQAAAESAGTRPAGAEPHVELALGLQQTAGNVRLQRALAGGLLQRQPPDAAPAPAPAPSPTPAPAAGTGVIQQALAQMRTSAEPIEQNTAAEVDSGRIIAMYIEDCPVDPDNDALLDGWGYDKTQFIVRLHPATKERMVVQTNADGTQSGNHIFIARAATVDRARTILIHEVNHAMRLHEGGHTDAADSFDRYQDEFQAYWVAEFRGVADLDERARRIRTHILGGYPALRARYDTDEDFKELVDNYTRPDANVLNSPRWQAVERAVQGLGTDEQAVYDAIRQMSGEERSAALADPNFMDLLRGDLSGDELQKAIFLLEGFSEDVIAALDAMSGMGTDEDALFAAVARMSPVERDRLRNNQWFIDRINDGELTAEELDKLMQMLAPVGDFPAPAGDVAYA